MAGFFAEGVVVDKDGNLYIADTGNQRVRKFYAAGRIDTVAGTGTAGFFGDGGLAVQAQLFNPFGLAVDVAGDIYIADANNRRIRKVDTAGRISTVAK